MTTANLPIRQQPKLIHYTAFGADTWGVRDGCDGRSGPFGPTGVTRGEAEAWLADPVRLVVVATLQDHHEAYGPDSYNDAGCRRCICGAEWPSDDHKADMIAGRLSAAGLT